MTTVEERIDDLTARRTAWAAWLSERMQRVGMTCVADLTRASGETLPVDTVIRWLRGVDQPTIGQARDAARGLGTTLLDVLVAAGQMTPDEAGVSVVHRDAPLDGVSPERLLAELRSRLDCPAA